jgi:VCBS repeat protein
MMKATSILSIGALAAIIAGCNRPLHRAQLSTPARGNPKEFTIQSYQGRFRCLDYTPGSVGSQVFINDCKLAHPIVVEELADGKHTVILHAGTLVIGIRVAPTFTTGAPSFAIAPPAQNSPDIPLQLQSLGKVGELPLTQNHFFSLDGDSIILASNRDLVVKIQNARGAVGSPVVIGTRNLADNEFWNFLPTNGVDHDPTTGFVRIGYPGDPSCSDNATCIARLYAVVSDPSTGYGTVIKLGTSLDLDASVPDLFPSLHLPAGVTIRGDRQGTNYGPEIHKSFTGEEDVFVVDGDDVRITRFGIHGPSRSTDEGQPNRNGIRVGPKLNVDGFVVGEFQRTLIDHLTITSFTTAGVNIDEGNPNIDCTRGQNSDPLVRPLNVHVARNFIAYNREQELGYGVVVSQGGWALVEGNTFVSNRHAIAGDGKVKSGYKAFSNLVLSAAPLQHHLFHTMDFDMHGSQPGGGGFGGTAGDYVGVFSNTFLGTNRPNLEIRGTPCTWVDYARNISLEDEDDAISLSLGFLQGTPLVDLRVSPQPYQFNHSNPTDHLGVGDFDGDGDDDLFLATGAAWYYSAGGKTDWRLLSVKTETLDQLLFGDFDGDGRTDVVTLSGGQFLVSWGGISHWEVLNPDPTGGRLFLLPSAISAMATGNFLGDQRSEIFWADGSTWWVSDGGSQPFVEVQTSGFTVPNLRFGDFNGDGRTDVFSVGSRDWQVSYAPTSGHGLFSAWTSLRPKLTDTVNGLVVADFNGDGFADVAGNCDEPACWRISYGGFQDWYSVTQPYGLVGPELAGIGHFRGDAPADVLSWNLKNDYYMCDPTFGQNTQLCIQTAGITPAQHYSTQDMR